MKGFLPVGAIFAAAFLAFLPTLSNGWIWDDDDYVTENPTLVQGNGLEEIWLNPSATPQYYPLVHTSFWLETRLWGFEPAGFHATNIFLHGLAAVLLWRFLLRLGFRGAWLTGLLFAVHPVMTESVAWVTERKNVLSGVFYFGAALTWLRFQSTGRWRLYTAATLLFIGALLSKTVTASLPAALLVVLWWQHGRLKWGWTWPLALWVPFGAWSGLHTATLERNHVHAEGHYWDLSGIERLLVAGKSSWLYLQKLIAPIDLAFFYERWTPSTADVSQWLCLLAVPTCLAGLWWFRNRIGRGPLAAFLIFGGTLFPALGILNVYPHKFSWVADHFQYHAAAAMLALFAYGLSHPRLPKYAGIVLCLPLIGLSFQQSKIYSNLHTLWLDTVAKTPTSAAAHANLAGWEWRNGNRQEALEGWRRALEEDKADLSGLTSLVQFGNPNNAPRLVKQLEKYYPGSWDTNYAKSFHALRSGDYLTAIQAGKNALLSPDRKSRAAKFGRTYLNIGAAQVMLKDWKNAAASLQEAVQRVPEIPAAFAFLGTAQAGAGQTKKALRTLANALPPRGQEVVAFTTLAWIHSSHVNASFRDNGMALRAGKAAVDATRSQDSEALDAYAAALANAGRWAEAAQTIHKAQRLMPKNRGINRRASLYAQRKVFRSPTGLPD